GLVKRLDTPIGLLCVGTSPPGAHSDVEAHGVLFRLHGFPELEQPLAGHRKSRLLPLQEPRKRKSLRPSLCPAFTIEDLCLPPYRVRGDSLLRCPQNGQGNREVFRGYRHDASSVDRTHHVWGSDIFSLAVDISSHHLFPTAPAFLALPDSEC